METVICKNCNAQGLRMEKGFLVCEYCGSRFLPSKEEQSLYSKGSSFSLGGSETSPFSLTGDVERLLEKCKSDPRNARKYANLILDIDPDNEAALKYL